MEKFTELHQRFWETLDNGQRAEIRRASTPGDLECLPAFYHLIGYQNPGYIKQLARVAFLLPFAEKHSENAKPLGRQLNDGKISEKRIFQIVRSSSPNDLVQLRRAVQQAKLKSIDWDAFGKSLFYWGERSKKQLVQNFFIYTKEEE
ncbi:CRISPR-associated protein, Cse2 family [Methanolobus vulcani]|uniref:CRISPR-associated protein, Cse2 family n=1 Tax=Methanolobus vulcani TaxID=38026 RepID=A0A7Z7AUG4_9EURY|nr:type I-E CRISPR-associated protein Cse2/CasB [Methanolobus vulcani]SDF31128.1 CRISPR-associated protein, Cse2 family [Methanolobus vulcani]